MKIVVFNFIIQKKTGALNPSNRHEGSNKVHEKQVDATNGLINIEK
jgi:hypothetical protein